LQYIPFLGRGGDRNEQGVRGRVTKSTLRGTQGHSGAREVLLRGGSGAVGCRVDVVMVSLAGASPLVSHTHQ